MAVWLLIHVSDAGFLRNLHARGDGFLLLATWLLIHARDDGVQGRIIMVIHNGRKPPFRLLLLRMCFFCGLDKLLTKNQAHIFSTTGPIKSLIHRLVSHAAVSCFVIILTALGTAVHEFHSIWVHPECMR